nr:hypothetical protein [Candidatus Sigynarchaeota archaeon]
MTENTRIDGQLDYELELAKDLRRNLRFYLKEIELIADERHIEEILGEIVYMEISCTDKQTKAYITRKLKDLVGQYPLLRI